MWTLADNTCQYNFTTLFHINVRWAWYYCFCFCRKIAKHFYRNLLERNKQSNFLIFFYYSFHWINSLHQSCQARNRCKVKCGSSLKFPNGFTFYVNIAAIILRARDVLFFRFRIFYRSLFLLGSFKFSFLHNDFFSGVDFGMNRSNHQEKKDAKE